jgi:hypothetical protein
MASLAYLRAIPARDWMNSAIALVVIGGVALVAATASFEFFAEEWEITKYRVWSRGGWGNLLVLNRPGTVHEIFILEAVVIAIGVASLLAYQNSQHCRRYRLEAWRRRGGHLDEVHNLAWERDDYYNHFERRQRELLGDVWPCPYWEVPWRQLTFAEFRDTMEESRTEMLERVMLEVHGVDVEERDHVVLDPQERAQAMQSLLGIQVSRVHGEVRNPAFEVDAGHGWVWTPDPARIALQ